MEEYDDEGKEDPKEWMKTPYSRASPVQLQNMLLVCRSLCGFFYLRIQVSTKFEKLKPLT